MPRLSCTRARTYDGAYTDLEIAWKGCRWRVQTSACEDVLVILVTPSAVAEPRAPLVVAELGLLWNRPGRLEHGADGPRAETADAATTLYGTGEPVAEPYLWTQGPCVTRRADAVVGFAAGAHLSLEEIRARVDKAAAARAAETHAWGELGEVRDAMQTCLAWDTVYDPLRERVISPVSRRWNCNWGGYVMFCWDSYFAAAMAAVDHRDLAYANAIEITREGIGNGFVPNFVSPSGYQSRDRSQPPVGAMTVRQIHERHGARWFLEAVFDDLLTWNRWWPAHRELDGLLAWGSHPYAPVVGNDGETRWTNTRMGAALESGLDNAPMYDDIPFDEERHVLLLQDVGLTSLYIRDCEDLAAIAQVLQRGAEEAELRQRAQRYAEAMQGLWCEETGLFLNRRVDTGAFEHRLSPCHFYPLLAGVPSDAQAQRMVEEHLLNPQAFGGDWVLPSCARHDPAYADQEYWRGRIWAPMNWLVYLGLWRYRLGDARAWLVERSTALLLKEWREHGHVHENYCADTGQGCNASRSDAFYHWGGLLGLMAIVEHEREAST